MCVICVMNNRRLTKREFKRAFDKNPHGFGLAYEQDGKVIAHKGFMKMKHAWTAYHDVPIPHVAHFRIASAGGVCPELTHPFEISNESVIQFDYKGTNPVLFHNGTIGDWKSMLITAIMQTGRVPTKPMSDSRAMAIILSLTGKDLIDLMGFPGKFAIVSSSGISTIGDFIDDGGNLFSNATYKDEAKVASRTSRDVWLSGSLWSVDSRGFISRKIDNMDEDLD